MIASAKKGRNGNKPDDETAKRLTGIVNDVMSAEMETPPDGRDSEALQVKLAKYVRERILRNSSPRERLVSLVLSEVISVSGNSADAWAGNGVYRTFEDMADDDASKCEDGDFLFGLWAGMILAG